MKTLKRMWIDQPSIHQNLHHLHGVNVLFDKKHRTIYFLAGKVISQTVPENPLPLSKGWINQH